MDYAIFGTLKLICMKRIFCLAVVVSIVASSCHLFNERVRGSGNVATVVREAHGFNSIDVSSSINVYVKQDSAESVKVVVDDNLQPYIHVSVQNGVLVIEQERNTSLRPTSGIRVYVSAPAFVLFKASGACNYYTENKVSATDAIKIDLSGASDAKMEIMAPKITADISGAGSVILSGETKDLSLDASGASSFKCMGMMAENVAVDLSGASNAEVFASVKLDVDASGASGVTYKGNAAVNQKTSGASSIKKVD